MEKKERLIEVRTADGKPILSLLLTDRDAAAGERQGASASQAPEKVSVQDTGRPGNGGRCCPPEVKEALWR